MRKALYFILAIITALQSFAQSTGTLKTAPVQLTLVTPVGTNGTSSLNTINYFSINILGGYHAGLSGFEFGGIANLNRDFMKGFQFAGIANYTGADAKGCQFAGISNVNIRESGVFQFAGILNSNIGSTNGLQIAGILNVTLSDSKAGQAAGICNFANNIDGAQIGGIANFTLAHNSGAQVGGIFNFSSSIKGVQIAGITNIAERVNGAQIAGAANIARNINGMQIGVVNIADTISNGIPIGVVSFVRKGFKEFEFGFSEGLNTYASLKLGVDKFYNIFSMGTQFIGDFRWGVGYGLGTHLVNKNDFKINLEAISYQINEGTGWTDAYNGLQQIKLTFAGGSNEHVKYFVGPSFNLLVSDYVNKNGEKGSGFPPYQIIDHMSGNTNLKFWIGINTGVRIH